MLCQYDLGSFVLKVEVMLIHVFINDVKEEGYVELCILHIGWLVCGLCPIEIVVWGNEVK